MGFGKKLKRGLKKTGTGIVKAYESERTRQIKHREEEPQRLKRELGVLKTKTAIAKQKAELSKASPIQSPFMSMGGGYGGGFSTYGIGEPPRSELGRKTRTTPKAKHKRRKSAKTSAKSSQKEKTITIKLG